MPNTGLEIALTDKETEIVKEVQTTLGLSSIEEAIEFLARERIKEMLAKLAGQEFIRNRHLF